MKKLFAIAVSAAILLFQATEAVWPSGGWYWPFMDYPMYAVAHPAGDIFYQYRFRVTDCDAPGNPRPVGNEDMGVTFFDFEVMLSRAAAVKLRGPVPPERRDAAIAELTRLATLRLPGACSADVQVKRHVIEEDVGYREPDWEVARSWSLRPGGDVAPESTAEGSAR